MDRQVRVSTLPCDISESSLRDCSCSTSLRFEIARDRQPVRLCRLAKRLRIRDSVQVASISSTLEDLKKLLPHVDLPRFPPVARRFRETILGSNTPQRACENGYVQRKRQHGNTLVTRDVNVERGVLALEVTGGRKRVYKRRDGHHPDGSFDMVQVCPRRVCNVCQHA
jgi:hypothetical protein